MKVEFWENYYHIKTNNFEQSFDWMNQKAIKTRAW